VKKSKDKIRTESTIFDGICKLLCSLSFAWTWREEFQTQGPAPAVQCSMLFSTFCLSVSLSLN